ncbi:MAG: nucleotide sugar dehydrogenase [Bdellovibrionaceae bacterium]|nr:nucleotide sugar dehydrogenase [Pseudobdellovibrionaceae bacterium]
MKKISIIGGCGHVGLPLGLTLAQAGHQVQLVDLNDKAVQSINKGVVPFVEAGATEILAKTIGKTLFATTSSELIRASDVVVFVTGTPVDEHLNPRVHDVVKVINSYKSKINKNALVVLRSTVYPGVLEIIDAILRESFEEPLLAFCPERIVQGKGIEEIGNLPQLISATSQKAEDMAHDLFVTIAPKVIRLKPKEAEIAKLMTNAWRYLEFAAANQFYMMVESQGMDFYKIFNALRDDYPRAQHFPRPGFAAGPCLFKDTMQLSAFHKSHFFLGQSAMLVNEGLPVFVADQMEKKLGGSLKGKSLAILGMTFKPNNDDIRESLSFKLKKVLEMRMANVICSDPYLKDSVDLETAIEKSHGIILGVPHNQYLNLKINRPTVDCWGVWRKGE